jgi:F-type H+-transporting ATPase subunit delta
MTNEDLVRGYAEALFSVADAEGVLERVEDELYAFARAVEQHADLREALTDATLPSENKKAVLAELLGDRAHPVTVNALSFVVESRRARELGKIMGELASLTAERRQRALAEVRSAVELTAQQRARLTEALSEATGRAVEVKVVVDPTVVGGVIARVGDEVFDGSIASRLDDARQHLGAAR